MADVIESSDTLDSLVRAAPVSLQPVLMSLAIEPAISHYGTRLCRVGFPACRLVGLSSPRGYRRLESRRNRQAEAYLPHNENCCDCDLALDRGQVTCRCLYDLFMSVVEKWQWSSALLFPDTLFLICFPNAIRRWTLR